MKFIKGLLLTLSLFVFFSCATTEKGTDSEPMETEQPVTAEDKTEKKMVEVEVENRVYFPTKEMVFYGDGQIDTITTYTYNENFDLLSKIQTNEQGEVLESHITTFQKGLLVRENNFGFGNLLNSYTVFEYNSDGNVIKDTLFDKEDKIQSISDYEYLAKNMVSWRTLGPTGGVLAITTYVYDDIGNNIKIEMRDAGSSIDGVIEKSYQDNKISEEKIMDSKGNIEKSATYVYEGENLIEKIYFDNKDKKKRSESYEYTNSLPVPSKINQHYKSGALEAYTNVEYSFKIVKSIIWVEE